jgi:hypothetical protein
MKFNHKTQETYITIDDVINESSFTSKDIQDKLGEQFDRVVERDLSRNVYRYLNGLRRGFDNARHTRILNALIFNNRKYQRAMKLAMVEMVKGAMYSGMDLNAYSAEVLKAIPDTVLHELKNGGLIDLVGTLHIDDELLDDIEATYPNFDLILDV